MAKTALITGASRGIGAAIAEKFAKEGYNLGVCCSKSEGQLQALAKSIMENYHVTVKVYIGDVSSFAFVGEMVKDLLASYGVIDVLVNNAGISYIGLLTDMTVEEWNQIIATNLSSVFLTCKCVVPSMVARKMGKIINISSVWGNVGASCEVAYSATKGGMNAFTKALGKELAPSNIQVNAIACGVIDTQMNACFLEEEREALLEEIPAGRMGEAIEVAELAYSIATGNSYLNGQIITLDGGWC